MNLLASWNPSGNGLENASQLLIILSVLTAFAFAIPTIYVSYNVIKFKKIKETNFKYSSKLISLLQFTSFAIEGIFIMLCWLFFYGKNILPNNPNLANILTWTFFGVSMLFAIFSYYIAMMLPQYLGTAFDNENIYIVGESFKLEKLDSIIHDISRKSIYINYLVGSKNIKKWRFNEKTEFAFYVLSNASIFNIKVIETDENNYIKERIQTLKLESQDLLSNTEEEKSDKPDIINNENEKDTTIIEKKVNKSKKIISKPISNNDGKKLEKYKEPEKNKKIVKDKELEKDKKIVKENEIGKKKSKKIDE